MAEGFLAGAVSGIKFCIRIGRQLSCELLDPGLFFGLSGDRVKQMESAHNHIYPVQAGFVENGFNHIAHT